MLPTLIMSAIGDLTDIRADGDLSPLGHFQTPDSSARHSAALRQQPLHPAHRPTIVNSATDRQTAAAMTESPIQPPHEVRTERLILRSARAGDGPALRLAIGVSLNEFFPWLSFSAQLDDHETLERVSQLAQSKFLEGEFYVTLVGPDMTANLSSMHFQNHSVLQHECNACIL